MKDMPDMILEQAAVSYAKGVYKDLGWMWIRCSITISLLQEVK